MEDTTLGKIFSFGGSSGDLTSGEITFIIELLAAMKTSEEIQEAFMKFTNGEKKLSGSTIQQIQLKYADRIKSKNKAYLNNIEGCPLAHAKVRLEIAQEVIRDSMVKRSSRTMKITNDEGEDIIVPEDPKMDGPTILNALKYALAEMTQVEEAKSQRPPGEVNEDESWQLDNGTNG